MSTNSLRSSQQQDGGKLIFGRHHSYSRDRGDVLCLCPTCYHSLATTCGIIEGCRCCGGVAWSGSSSSRRRRRKEEARDKSTLQIRRKKRREEKRRRKEACSAFTIAYASTEWKKVEREKTLEVKN